MTELLVPIGLVLLGLLILFLEAFIPSAGVLSVISTLCLVGGVGAAYYYGGFSTGTAFMVCTMVVVGVLISSMVKWWPHTALGKLILVEPPPADELVPDRSEIEALVGRVGQALSLMLPSGLIDIDGKHYDAFGNSTIEKGTWVEVTSVRGRNLMVRPVSEEVARREQADRIKADDPLSQSVNQLLADPFEDPLG